MRRLREPRYLIGAVVGAVYLYFVFLHRVLRRGRRAGPGSIPAEILAPLQLAGAFMLWLIVAVRWIVPVSRQPLEFSGAERDFLLVAPMARRRIVTYKLLRSQVGILLSTLLMLLFAWSAVASAWSFVLGTFLLFTTLRLHLLGVAVSRGSLVQTRGRGDPAAVVALAALAVTTLGVIAAAAPGVACMWQTQDMARALHLVQDQTSRPAVAAALLPVTVVIRPIFAEWPGPFALAALPVLALAMLNFAWVVSAEGRLEFSISASEREVLEGQRTPARASYRRAPFSLASRGSAESALVWKNLIMLGRYASPAMLLRLAVPLVLVAVMIGTSRRTGLASLLFSMSWMLAGGLAVLGPYSFRNDLRQDLVRLPVLKSWPISGERLLWGEVLAPSAVLTTLVWLVLLLLACLSLALPAESLPWTKRLAFGLSALVLAPALILAQVVIQNAVVVLFPGWVVTGPSRPRGVEAMGQQMLMFAGTVLLLAVGLLPGAAVGAVVTLVGYQLFGWLALIPAAVLVSLLLVGEAFVAIRVLGPVLDRTDPAALDTTV